LQEHVPVTLAWLIEEVPSKPASAKRKTKTLSRPEDMSNLSNFHTWGCCKRGVADRIRKGWSVVDASMRSLAQYRKPTDLCNPFAL
jgi:hypothetical protein